MDAYPSLKQRSQNKGNKQHIYATILLILGWIEQTGIGA
jgi:hypothetical protein